MKCFPVARVKIAGIIANLPASDISMVRIHNRKALYPLFQRSYWRYVGKHCLASHTYTPLLEAFSTSVLLLSSFHHSVVEVHSPLPSPRLSVIRTAVTFSSRNAKQRTSKDKSTITSTVSKLYYCSDCVWEKGVYRRQHKWISLQQFFSFLFWCSRAWEGRARTNAESSHGSQRQTTVRVRRFLYNRPIWARLYILVCIRASGVLSRIRGEIHCYTALIRTPVGVKYGLLSSERVRTDTK